MSSYEDIKHVDKQQLLYYCNSDMSITIDFDCVSIKGYKKYLAQTPHLNRSVVIPMKQIRILYDYPLSNEVTFTHDAPTDRGFTRKDLITIIGEDYHRIYKEEENTCGNPGPIGRGSSGIYLMNRKRSHGPYGIWGHDIGDLVIEEISQQEGNLFLLSIGS